MTITPENVSASWADARAERVELERAAWAETCAALERLKGNPDPAAWEAVLQQDAAPFASHVGADRQDSAVKTEAWILKAEQQDAIRQTAESAQNLKDALEAHAEHVRIVRSNDLSEYVGQDPEPMYLWEAEASVDMEPGEGDRDRPSGFRHAWSQSRLQDDYLPGATATVTRIRKVKVFNNENTNGQPVLQLETDAGKFQAYGYSETLKDGTVKDAPTGGRFFDKLYRQLAGTLRDVDNYGNPYGVFNKRQEIIVHHNGQYLHGVSINHRPDGGDDNPDVWPTEDDGSDWIRDRDHIRRRNVCYHCGRDVEGCKDSAGWCRTETQVVSGGILWIQTELPCEECETSKRDSIHECGAW